METDKKKFERDSKSDLGNCRSRKRSYRGDKVAQGLVIQNDSGKIMREILINDQ